MTRLSRATVRRLAAVCGLIAFPAVARAQLKCLSPADPEISKVSFEGNSEFTSAELRLHVLAEPTDLVRKVFRRVFGTKRCLRNGLLASDSIRLTNFYLDQGFANAVIRDTAILSADQQKAAIVFMIREGEPVRTDSVALVPADLSKLGLGNDLLGALRLRQGQRYSQAIAQADADTIETRMHNSGYPQGRACIFELNEPARPDCPIPPAASGSRESVRIEVRPGPLTRIGRVTIRDTAITGKSAVITDKAVRQLLPFKEGDIYQERLLTQAQRQLYQLGTFYHASVDPQAPTGPADSVADVDVLVVEEYMRQFNSRTGWGTQDCFTTGGQYTDKAFSHSINRFEASAQVSKLLWAPPTDYKYLKELCRHWLDGDEIASTKLNYSATLRYTQPAAFGGLLDRSVAAYSEVRGAYKAYLRTTLIGIGTSVSKLLTESPTLDQAYKRSVVGLLGYNIEYGHTNAPDAVFCFVFRACTDTARSHLSRDEPLSVLNGAVTRDWRDNALLPTSGTLARVEGRLSSRVLGSGNNVEFRKGTADLTWYHPALKSDVLAIRFRAGWIGGGSSTPGSQFIPPQERLYTGGETSVRGFGTNELGPLIYVVSDTGGARPAGDSLDLNQLKIVQRLPLGGNAMLVWNFEYRIRGPLFTNRLQTILFADAGKLWTPGAEGTVLPYKWTPGVAFRVFTPVGPVQLNVAYNNYRDPAGAVFFDPGISQSSTGQLICLSSTNSAGECQATFAPRLAPATFRNLFHLRFSIAFPPDY